MDQENWVGHYNMVLMYIRGYNFIINANMLDKEGLYINFTSFLFVTSYNKVISINFNKQQRYILTIRHLVCYVSHLYCWGTNYLLCSGTFQTL